jgi:hypothetical protein
LLQRCLAADWQRRTVLANAIRRRGDAVGRDVPEDPVTIVQTQPVAAEESTTWFAIDRREREMLRGYFLDSFHHVGEDLPPCADGADGAGLLYLRGLLDTALWVADDLGWWRDDDPRSEFVLTLPPARLRTVLRDVRRDAFATIEAYELKAPDIDGYLDVALAVDGMLARLDVDHSPGDD